MINLRTLAAAVIVCSIVIGGIVALAASYASVQSYAKRGALETAPEPSPTPTQPQPSPTVSLSPGLLGNNPRLLADGTVLVATGDNTLSVSEDGGATWRPAVLPAGAAGLVIAPSNSKRRITGGASVQVSDDRGVTWHLPRTAPPGPGPFTPLAINPSDPDVWFIAAHGRLLRTRDGGVSWRELAGVGADASSLIASTGQKDAFVLTNGSQVFQLTDNGTQVQNLPALPDGVKATDLAVAGIAPALVLAVRASDGSDYIAAGSTWNKMPLAGPVAAETGHWAIVADGAHKAGTAADLRLTADGGASWTTAKGLPDDQSVDALAVTSGPNPAAYAYTFAGDIYRSVNGTTWTLLGKGLAP